MKRAAYFEHHSHDYPAGRFRRRIERLFAECGIELDRVGDAAREFAIVNVVAVVGHKGGTIRFHA